VPLLQHYRTAPARSMIYRAGEPLNGMPTICDGWAARVSHLPNGRRQILSFLLPGDFVSFVAMFTDVFDFFVEAITPVRYSYYNRASIEARLARQPGVFRAWTTALLQEKKQADQLVADLGRRSAEARIARLFLSLRERLGARGMISGQSFAFPLRQQHIADATGLTPVYVSHVLASFRQGGLIAMAGRSMTIINLAGLEHAAGQN
jgi:CRP/FNR family transcriptional regulator, anaerobic regulatory protein